jgi:hypothetical protein
MFLALWEFEVKPGCQERFEKVYGPNGDWAQLFRRDPHYWQTLFLHDPFRERIYVTIDFWSSREAYERFRQEHREAYVLLDKNSEELTLSERRIGAFEQLSESQ